nr:immunoglobulin light chain junction region [Macaca mulatta]MOW53682.1 immunoglobulin light chain junction region [Macaca mulatta]MOW54527.1 immunoglobulin light chain junction region [Macaca mulatta]MOW54619.1 immunoglobulin light chain junction region [Macaca mulatta]
CQQYHSDPSF